MVSGVPGQCHGWYEKVPEEHLQPPTPRPQSLTLEPVSDDEYSPSIGSSMSPGSVVSLSPTPPPPSPEGVPSSKEPLTLEPCSPQSKKPYTPSRWILSPKGTTFVNDAGSIKMSFYPEDKAHLYKNFRHLYDLALNGRDKFGEGIPGGWGAERGKTYGLRETGCIPTQEEITALRKGGIKFWGKIVMKDGSVYNADIKREVEEMSISKKIKYMKEYDEKVKEQSTWGECIKEFFAPKSVVVHCYTAVQGIFRGPPKSKHNYPIGTYHLNEKSSSVDHNGHIMLKMCDDVECCLRSHVAIEMAENGHKDYNKILNWHSKRQMYTRKSEEEGNFDLCYHCMNKCR